LTQKKEFNDYLLEKKVDAEVSEEINSRLQGANQQAQGDTNQQMANQSFQTPQDFQQLLNQLKAQAQAHQQMTDGKVNQAIQQAINALTQAQQSIQANQVFYQMNQLLDQSTKQLQQLNQQAQQMQQQHQGGQQLQ